MKRSREIIDGKQELVEHYHNCMDALENGGFYTKARYPHPLHRAVVMANYPLMREILSHRDVFNINDVGDEGAMRAEHKHTHYLRGMTALHIACSAGESCSDGKIKLVSFLLNYLPNPNLQDIEGSTPLHYAIFRGDWKVSNLLLDEFADVDIVNGDSQWPVEMALHNLPAQEFLKVARRSRHINSVFPESGHGLIHVLGGLSDATSESCLIKFAQIPGVNINLRDRHSATVLHTIAHRRCDPQALLDLGVDPNARNSAAVTPTQIAVGHFDASYLKPFILAGADPRLIDWKGLYSKARAGRDSVVDTRILDVMQQRFREYSRLCAPLLCAAKVGFYTPPIIEVLATAGVYVPRKALIVNRASAEEALGTERWCEIQKAASKRAAWNEGSYFRWLVMEAGDNMQAPFLPSF